MENRLVSTYSGRLCTYVLASGRLIVRRREKVEEGMCVCGVLLIENCHWSPSPDAEESESDEDHLNIVTPNFAKVILEKKKRLSELKEIQQFCLRRARSVMRQAGTTV
jgi:hypothetical protein